jgi:MFS family permease
MPHAADTDVAAASAHPPPLPGARKALVLLLLINLFNYMDRYVLAAVESEICKDLLGSDSAENLAKMGSLATAFIVSYMVASPIFGWLADRMSRWLLVGIGVTLWSLASGASGLAGTFAILLITRLFVGIGEAGYGPAAPTIISDMYPISRRGSVLAWFYLAIPVGSALGYGLGGMMNWIAGWRWAFYAVVLPGLILGVLSFLMKDPPRGHSDAAHTKRKASFRDYLSLLKTKSYVLNSLGMTAMTFAIGGISYWMPRYISSVRGAGSLTTVNLIFGGITVVAGISATLLGGKAGDALRNRGMGGAYFIVSAAGILAACPCILLMLWLPFPWAWIAVFAAEFCLFFNTGPSNTILANVTHPSVRATGFALNIFIIHALGDAISPPLLGAIAGWTSWTVAFCVVVAATALGGVFWVWGARYLESDTLAASTRLGVPEVSSR